MICLLPTLDDIPTNTGKNTGSGRSLPGKSCGVFREGPVTILRRTDPERYSAFVERKRAMMKELYSKERRRMKLVLPRRTALHIPQVNYTRSQVLHRHNALKRGYVLAEDCSDDGGYRYVIFFDAGTRRSARFERNLAMDGFHVEEWKFG